MPLEMARTAVHAGSIEFALYGFSSAVAADALRAISAARPAIAVKVRLIGFLLSRFMATNPAALKAHLRDATRHHP